MTGAKAMARKKKPQLACKDCHTPIINPNLKLVRCEECHLEYLRLQRAKRLVAKALKAEPRQGSIQ